MGGPIQIGTKFALDVFWNRFRVGVSGVGEECLKMLTHYAVKDGLGGPAWRIRGREPSHACVHGDGRAYVRPPCFRGHAGQ